jgi:hypothetical protein
MMSCRPEKLEILPMEDEQAVMVNLYRVTNSLLAGRISEKVAGLALWSIAIGAPGAGRLSPQRSRTAQRKKTLPLMNTDHTDLKKDEKQDRTCDSGVTHDKSFKSGVTVGSTPEDRRQREGNTQHGDTHPSKPKSGSLEIPGTETRRNPGSKPTAGVTPQTINSLSKGTLCLRSPY